MLMGIYDNSTQIGKSFGKKTDTHMKNRSKYFPKIQWNYNKAENGIQDPNKRKSTDGQILITTQAQKKSSLSVSFLGFLSVKLVR